MRSGSPRTRISSPEASASTMSPRWTLSSMPLRSWRTRMGVATWRRAAILAAGRRGRWAAGAVTGRAISVIGRARGRRGYRGGARRASVRWGSTPRPMGPPVTRPLESVRRRSPVSTPTLHVSRHPAVLHKLAILRDEKTEPKKFREIVRELSWLLGLRGARRRRRQADRDPDADGADDRPRAGRAGRVRADPAGRSRDGRRDAGADADRAGLAPRPVPRRADAPTRSSTTTSSPTPPRWTCA